MISKGKFKLLGGKMENIKLNTSTRYNEIIHYNIIMIVMNLMLSAAKIAAGILTNAHAVILDGVEGLSDLVSSIFTIISAIIGAKKADKAHPFGYGRMEYLVSMFVTIIIIYVGLRSIVEAVKEILNPNDPPDYNIAIVLLMCISLVLKISYGLILRKKGRELNSTAMIISGTDCMGDALTSASILAAILIKKIFDVDIEHYLCIGISFMIILTGVQMMRESADKILGTPVDPELRQKIRQMIIMEDGVYNVDELVIHNYGEGVYVGSAGIEVDENMRAAEISSLSRKLTDRAKELGITLTAIGITGTNTNSPEADRIWDKILDTVRENKNISRAHSFSVDFKKKQIYFSIVPNLDAPDIEKNTQELSNKLQSIFPDMSITIQSVKAI